MNNEKNIIRWPWIIFGTVAIIFPVIMFLIWKDDSLVDWVGFWASYAGAILGATASLVALYITFKQNEQDNKLTRLESYEKNRLDILPYLTLKCQLIGFDESFGEGMMITFDPQKNKTEYLHSNDLDTRYSSNSSARFQGNFFRLIIVNYGSGPALECQCVHEGEEWAGDLGVLCPREVKAAYLHFIETFGEFNFRIIFQDIQDRKYEQKFSVSYNLSNESGAAVLSVKKSQKPLAFTTEPFV